MKQGNSSASTAGAHVPSMYVVNDQTVWGALSPFMPDDQGGARSPAKPRAAGVDSRFDHRSRRMVSLTERSRGQARGGANRASDYGGDVQAPVRGRAEVRHATSPAAERGRPSRGPLPFVLSLQQHTCSLLQRQARAPIPDARRRRSLCPLRPMLEYAAGGAEG